jgi:hypothetical protein
MKDPIRLHSICVLFVLIALSRPVDASQVEAGQPAWLPGELPHTLVLALDGVPYSFMEAMYAAGHFRQFFRPSRMVSTFPSMTDVAFSEIFALAPPQGYQQVYYSYENNQRVGGLGRELFHLQEFERRFHALSDSKLHLLSLYVTSRMVAHSEWRRLARRFRASNDTPVFYGYIAGTDSIAHRHGVKALWKFMRYLERRVADLQEQYRAATGRKLGVILFSDHGNTMVKGRLIPAKQELKKLGYQYRWQLRNARSVVSPIAGIVSYWALYTDHTAAPALARGLVNVEGINAVLFIPPLRPGDIVPGVVGVVNQLGEARLHFDFARNRGLYEPVWGDPLEYRDVMARANEQGLVDEDGYVPQAMLFALTADHKYPDAIRRGYGCFYGAVQHPATIVVSLAPGYEFSSSFLKGLAVISTRWGTHGGLQAEDSLGVYMRTDRPTTDIGAADMQYELDLDYFQRQRKHRATPTGNNGFAGSVQTYNH